MQLTIFNCIGVSAFDSDSGAITPTSADRFITTICPFHPSKVRHPVALENALPIGNAASQAAASRVKFTR